MKKLIRKDRGRFGRVMKKIKEILKEPHIYKPLSNEMAGMRRVHFDPYVLTFFIDEKTKTVVFADFDHHDKIYKR